MINHVRTLLLNVNKQDQIELPPVTTLAAPVSDLREEQTIEGYTKNDITGAYEDYTTYAGGVNTDVAGSRTLETKQNRRNLVVNMSFPGEEYISPNFVPIEMPTELQRLWSKIFGTNPDRYMLNYRGQQLMAALHSTELAENVLDYDNRITYWPLKNDSFYNFNFGNVVTELGTFDGQIIFAGPPVANNDEGRLYNFWKVTVKDSDTVTVRKLTPPVVEVDQEYVLADGISNALELPGSSQKFLFNGPVGASWLIESFARPAKTMVDVLNDLQNTVSDADAYLFWGEYPTEPMLTYKNIWKKHPHYAYKLGAIALTMADYLDKRRVASNTDEEELKRIYGVDDLSDMYTVLMEDDDVLERLRRTGRTKDIKAILLRYGVSWEDLYRRLQSLQAAKNITHRDVVNQFYYPDIVMAEGEVYEYSHALGVLGTRGTVRPRQKVDSPVDRYGNPNPDYTG